jgi:hypothetical protein
MAADVAGIEPKNIPQQASRGLTNRPPPADAIQSVITIGSAI